MLYLAWRQRFGKASPRADLTNRRQEATKPFFKEIPPPKVTSRNLLWNFLHRTTDSSSTDLRPPLQQPAGSPITSHQNPDQQIALHPAQIHAIRGNALHKPTQRTAFPEVVRWEQTRSTSSAPPCTALPRATSAPRPQKKRPAASRTCLYPI